MSHHLRSGYMCRRDAFTFLLGLSLLNTQAMSQVAALEFKATNVAKVNFSGLGGRINQQVVPKDDFEKASPIKPSGKEPPITSECDDLSRAMLDANRLEISDPALKAVFSAKCMNDWTDRLETSPKTGMEQSLSMTLGLLVDGDGNPFCTGFRIAAGKVASAKHCFYDRKSGVQFRESKSIHFQLPGSIGKFQLLSGLAEVVTPYSASQDVLVLSIPTLANEPMPLVVLKKDVGVGEKILLIGMSPQFSKKVRLLSDSHKSGCIVAMKDASCFYHNCSAGEGFSGAPIFRSELDSAGALQVVGMHIEGVGTPGDTCQAPILRDYGNTALLITSQQEWSVP